jgi:hypothetical protein
LMFIAGIITPTGAGWTWPAVVRLGWWDGYGELRSDPTICREERQDDELG